MPYTYDYPRPMLTVDAAVFCKIISQINILLIKRKNEPYKDCWAFPGGFIEMDETLDEAIARELEEETGLKNISLKQYHTYGAIDRDPRGRTVTVMYFGIINEINSEIKAGDDAAEAKWFPIQNLPELAFDHSEICKNIIKEII